MKRELLESDHLLYRQLIDGIAVLVLNNPAKRNSLSTEVLTALTRHLSIIAEDPSVRVVVLRAEGPVFSAGHDLRELRDTDDESNARLFGLCTDVMEAIRLLPQPVIAQVNGLATAAGCQLVASCDIAIASEKATFATPGVKIGLFCTTPGVALARAVPSKKAMEMLLTGMPISAHEALQHGLVSRVVSAETLEEHCMDLARKVAASSSHVVALGKRAFYEQMELTRPAAYEVAQSAMVRNLKAQDAKEGIRAFLDKREPNWRDS